MGLYRVKSSELMNIINPLDGSMWKCGSISVEEIEVARRNKEFEERSWSHDGVVQEKLSLEESRTFHIRRIATMLEKGYTGKIIMALINHTQEIEAFVSDGNHSLAATYVRGDDEIELVIAASDPGSILKILPSARLINNA